MGVKLEPLDEAVAACGDGSSLPRSLGGWESVGDGMVGAYVDRCTSRIASLEPSGARGTSVSIDEAVAGFRVPLSSGCSPVIPRWSGPDRSEKPV